jgi:hypothetical protein
MLHGFLNMNLKNVRNRAAYNNPALPDQVTAAELTLTPNTQSIDISWTSQADATGYHYYWAFPNFAPIGDQAVAETDRSRTISNLNSEQEYLVRVDSTNSFGTTTGEWKSVTTQAMIPLAPNGLTIQTEDSTHVNFTWNSPIGAPDSYDVERRNITEGGAWTFVVQNKTSIGYNDTDIKSGRNYEWRVYAKNEQGTSPPSDPLNFTVDNTLSGEPQNVASSNIAKTSLTLTWEEPTTGGYPDTYRLFHRVQGNSTWVGVSGASALSNSTFSYNVTGLTADTTYEFIVEAVNSFGYATSAIHTVATVGTIVLLPNSDIAVGDWSTPPLFSKVNDNLFVTDIQSSNGNSYCTIGFAAATSAGSSGTLYFAISRTTGNSGLSYGIEIYNNGNLVQSVSYTEATVPLTTTEFSLEFTTPIAASDVLSVQLARTGGGNPNNRARANCSEMRIEY